MSLFEVAQYCSVTTALLNRSMINWSSFGSCPESHFNLFGSGDGGDDNVCVVVMMVIIVMMMMMMVMTVSDTVV